MGRLTHIITHYKLYHNLLCFASPIAEDFVKNRLKFDKYFSQNRTKKNGQTSPHKRSTPLPADLYVLVGQAAQVIDKLLCRPARDPAAEHFPFVCFGNYLLFIHLYFGVARGEGEHHSVKLGSRRLEKSYRYAEAIYQGELLLDGLGTVDIVPSGHIGSVVKGLLDKMTAV